MTVCARDENGSATVSFERVVIGEKARVSRQGEQGRTRKNSLAGHRQTSGVRLKPFRISKEKKRTEKRHRGSLERGPIGERGDGQRGPRNGQRLGEWQHRHILFLVPHPQ